MRTCVYNRYAEFRLRAKSFYSNTFKLKMLRLVERWTIQRTKPQKIEGKEGIGQVHGQDK